ncbi:TPA: restriction endonuclease subunit S [Klebsiella pneumoniae]|uniref:restriction endonuclease subunit S n=1 Tax=Klebsiella pneumoniae TaxID=573 RepID=UPI000E2CB6F7|nr:restriction endonuclease subunit S [Klebsiella pneumoniae]ELA0617350.1 restriction endonuclease subunit S [Klebsiella pneumoniae]SXG31640.1 Restriction modification system DNA specificity domain protein [Klebsiella pneumoniae]HDS3617187.1 restriction endonuclease subunit S [Klebsiella pneumoniae subsp. pneumoniae]HEE5049768.1 restriction endonuclease subunit S [Klebsiella pneumoniae]
MSEQSYLEKLLDGVEVEWVTLGSMADIGTGNSNRQDESENGIYPFYVRSKNILKSDTFEFDEVAIVIPGEGGIGDIFHYVEGKYALHQRAYRIRITTNAVDTKFLYYFMSSSFKQYILTKSVGATAISIRKPMLEGFKVPIPSPDNPEKSLAIQSEIVRILDKFTALTAELTAELTMRKKQYNYYRDQLLSFDDDEVEWKTLGEIGTWHGGGTPSKSRSEFWEDGSIPWISPKDMGRPIVDTSEDYITEEAVEQSSTKLVPANSIAIVVRSSILDKVMPSALIPVPATFNQDMKVVIPHCNISPNYIAHIMRSRGDDILRAAKKSGGSVASIDSKKLFSFRIPVPHLNEQKRIVNILDKFDTLANSITEGLPREIELRQKQYEYYRDLLFSFPRPETASN